MIREFSNRIERLRKVMERKELDALLLMNPKNVYYVSGFSPMVEGLPIAILLSNQGEPFLVLPEIELERSRDSSWLTNIKYYSSHLSSRKTVKDRSVASKTFIEEIQNLVRSHGLSSATMGTEFSYVTVNMFEILKGGLEKTGFKDASQDLLEIRSVKDLEEVEILRDSLEISERGIRAAIELVQPGMTEVEVAAEVERIMRKAGSNRTAFESVIASGLRSGHKLASAKQKRIDTNEFVVLNVSAIYNGYCSDVARTIYTGKPGEKHKRVFELSKKALAKAIEEIKPGTTSDDVTASVRAFLKSTPVEDIIGISGHGIGLELHEYPRISEDEVHLIKPGMVICVKVETSILEVGGLRMEETVVVTEDGLEVLNKLPLETV